MRFGIILLYRTQLILTSKGIDVDIPWREELALVMSARMNEDKVWWDYTDYRLYLIFQHCYPFMLKQSQDFDNHTKAIESILKGFKIQTLLEPVICTSQHELQHHFRYWSSSSLLTRCSWWTFTLVTAYSEKKIDEFLQKFHLLFSQQMSV